MARIVLSTWGSSGDLNPFIALAHGLRERGHDVLFVVDMAFLPYVEREGFAAWTLSGSAEEAFRPYQREMFGGTTALSSVRVIYTRYVLPLLRSHIAELREACRGADLLVAPFQTLAAAFVHALDGILWVSVVLSPVTIRTAYLPLVPLPAWLPDSAERAVYGAGWAAGAMFARRLVDAAANDVAREVGLAPRCDWAYEHGLSHALTAVAVSPAYAPRPPDWPTWVRETGFLFHDGGETWDEPSSLTAFLAAPTPVVAISSGSMGPFVPGAFDRFYETAITATRTAGARPLVIGAATGSLPDPLPPGTLAVPFAPFSRVYPRCAAVMHHGGIGTTAQGLRAGVPSFILPWGADQSFAGMQTERIGAGRWMPRQAFTPTRGTGVLRDLLRDPRYRENARSVAAAIAQEDGVGTLCDAIEGQLR